ncbi:hypothetical protein MIR68_003559 [Amoeboaphelidium protococcarum]|nr:hypothetical protein MIR68_003559 [Amoeboaphelidium protococcarum]
MSQQVFRNCEVLVGNAKTAEQCDVVLDKQFRVVVQKANGGKQLIEFNLRNLKALISKQNIEVVLQSFQKNQNVMTIQHKSDIEQIIIAIVDCVKCTFPVRQVKIRSDIHASVSSMEGLHTKTEQMDLIVAVPWKELNFRSSVGTRQLIAGGMMNTYVACCHHLNVPVSQEALWLIKSQSGDCCLDLKLFADFDNKQILAILDALVFNGYYSRLVLTDIKFNSPDMAHALIHLLKWNQGLEEIVFGGSNQFPKEFLHQLSEAMKNCMHLQSVHLDDNSIDEKYTALLGSDLHQLQRGAKGLSLANCQLSKKGTVSFLSNFTKSSSGGSNAVSLTDSLQYLNLSGNSLGSDGVFALNELLQVPNQLSFLNLTNCGIPNLEILFAALMRGCTFSLKELHLQGNRFNNGQDCVPFESFLKSSQSLQVINMSETKLSSGQLKQLYNALNENISLLNVQLSLRNNDLGKKDISYIGQILPQLITVSAVDFSENDVSDDVAAIDLIEGLARNMKLKVIKLDKCFQKLSKSKSASNVRLQLLFQMQNVVELSLNDNVLGKFLSHSMESVKITGADGSKLQKLHLVNNSLGDDGSSSLCQLISQLQQLLFLDCSQNGISFVGWHFVARAAALNKSLREIVLPFGEMQSFYKSDKVKAERLFAELQQSCAQKSSGFNGATSAYNHWWTSGDKAVVSGVISKCQHKIDALSKYGGLPQMVVEQVSQSKKLCSELDSLESVISVVNQQFESVFKADQDETKGVLTQSTRPLMDVQQRNMSELLLYVARQADDKLPLILTKFANDQKKFTSHVMESLQSHINYNAISSSLEKGAAVKLNSQFELSAMQAIGQFKQLVIDSYLPVIEQLSDQLTSVLDAKISEAKGRKSVLSNTPQSAPAKVDSSAVIDIQSLKETASLASTSPALTHVAKDRVNLKNKRKPGAAPSRALRDSVASDVVSVSTDAPAIAVENDKHEEVKEDPVVVEKALPAVTESQVHEEESVKTEVQPAIEVESPVQQEQYKKNTREVVSEPPQPEKQANQQPEPQFEQSADNVVRQSLAPTLTNQRDSVSVSKSFQQDAFMSDSHLESPNATLVAEQTQSMNQNDHQAVQEQVEPAFNVQEAKVSQIDADQVRSVENVEQLPAVGGYSSNEVQQDDATDASEAVVQKASVVPPSNAVEEVKSKVEREPAINQRAFKTSLGNLLGQPPKPRPQVQNESGDETESINADAKMQQPLQPPEVPPNESKPVPAPKPETQVEQVREADVSKEKARKSSGGAKKFFGLFKSGSSSDNKAEVKKQASEVSIQQQSVEPRQVETQPPATPRKPESTSVQEQQQSPQIPSRAQVYEVVPVQKEEKPKEVAVEVQQPAQVEAQAPAPAPKAQKFGVRLPFAGGDLGAIGQVKLKSFSGGQPKTDSKEDLRANTSTPDSTVAAPDVPSKFLKPGTPQMQDPVPQKQQLPQQQPQSQVSQDQPPAITQSKPKMPAAGFPAAQSSSQAAPAVTAPKPGVKITPKDMPSSVDSGSKKSDGSASAESHVASSQSSPVVPQIPQKQAVATPPSAASTSQSGADSIKTMLTDSDQGKTEFFSWMNGKCQQQSITMSQKYDNLDDYFKDGCSMLEFIEKLSKQSVGNYKKNPKLIPHKIDNMNILISFMKDKLDLPQTQSILAEELVNAEHKKVLLFMSILSKKYP